MKNTRNIIREIIIESIKKEITLKEVDNAIIKCLKKEGGAAGLGMLVDVVLKLATKIKELPKQLSSESKIKTYIRNHPKLTMLREKDIVLKSSIKKDAYKEK